MCVTCADKRRRGWSVLDATRRVIARGPVRYPIGAATGLSAATGSLGVSGAEWVCPRSSCSVLGARVV